MTNHDSYASELVTVTWGWSQPERDQLHVTRVSLRHGRASGLPDDETIRRVLAIRYGNGSLAAARFVTILAVESVTPEAASA